MKLVGWQPIGVHVGNMKIPHTIVYAVQATFELAQAEPNCPISCRQLAARGQLPERYLLQILRTLVMQGILCSVRGVDGGYYLARAPHEITLLNLVDAFENPFEPIVPQLPGIAPQVHARLMASVVKTCAAARQEFGKLTLADLADCS